MTWRGLIPGIAVVLATLAPGGRAEAQTRRISTATDGKPGEYPSTLPAMSRDGRMIAFDSASWNLMSPVRLSSLVHQILIYDAQTATLTIATRGSDGVVGNADSTEPAISADGRFVAFASAATNLLSAGVDTNPSTDIFVRDLSTGTVVRASVTIDGSPANGNSSKPALSGNGRCVVFLSTAPNMVGDVRQPPGLFLFDRFTGRTTRIDAGLGGARANAMPQNASISHNGRWIVFDSEASNLVAGDTNGLPDVFLYDLWQNRLARVSVSDSGAQLDAASSGASLDDSGTQVAFVSRPRGFGPSTLYVRDRAAERTREIAKVSYVLSSALISGDASIVAFVSADDTLLPKGEDINRAADLFTVDVTNRSVRRVSVSDEGDPVSTSVDPVFTISGDGRTLAFSTSAHNLVANDSFGFGFSQVYLRRLDVDQDGDGLLDAWERRYGFSPASADGHDGPSGDPDGDGITNRDELRFQSHPKGFFRREFVAPTGSSRVVVFNPSDASAAVWLRGPTGGVALALPPLTRRDTLGVLSVITVESDVPVAIEQTGYNDDDMFGPMGGSSSAASTPPESSPIWYFAEGSTARGLLSGYAVRNLSSETVTIEYTYLRPAPAAPLVNWSLADPGATTSPPLQNVRDTDFGLVVRSLGGTPIVARRGTGIPSASQSSEGVRAPRTSWYFAEGATGNYFDTFLLLANPGMSRADVTVTFLLPLGDPVVKTFIVEAQSRFNIWADHADSRLADTAFGAIISSTQPIVAERSQWWPGPTAATWEETHASPAAASTGTAWAVADGPAASPLDYETFILIANTSPFVGQVRVTLFFDDASTTQRVFTVRPMSRFNVSVKDDFAELQKRAFSAIVESLGAEPAALVVERSTYGSGFNYPLRVPVPWSKGANVGAMRLR